MALYTVQTPVTTGITPVPITPTVSDTIAGSDIGPGSGVILRVVTTGTATNVSILDPNVTALGNPGTVSVIACPATGVRTIFVPPAAVNNNLSTPVATVTFSSITGVTLEAYRS